MARPVATKFSMVSIFEYISIWFFRFFLLICKAFKVRVRFTVKVYMTNITHISIEQSHLCLPSGIKLEPVIWKNNEFCVRYMGYTRYNPRGSPWLTYWTATSTYMRSKSSLTIKFTFRLIPLGKVSFCFISSSYGLNSTTTLLLKGWFLY